MPPDPATLTETLAFHDTAASAARARADAKRRGVSLAAHLRECLALRRRFSDADVALILGRPSSPMPPELDQG
jgi:hypothetical protein